MSKTVIDGVDYGPLACLIGSWSGDSGMDVAPEPDADEHNPYFETIRFEAAGDVTNAEEQTMSVVRYHQQVSRQSNKKVFHDQVGYWLWEAATGKVVQTLSIPRAVALLAGGSSKHENGKTILSVQASEHEGDWNITQSPFMRDNARTVAYRLSMVIENASMSYEQTTFLNIYGKQSYEHTDRNDLSRLT